MSANSPKPSDQTDTGATAPTRPEDETPHRPAGTRETEASRGAIGGTQDHGTVRTPQGRNVSTPGEGPATHGQADDAKNRAQAIAREARNAMQEKTGDIKERARGALDETNEQARGKFDAVSGQTQDTLESVRASLQTKTGALKETVTGKTDHLRETMTGKTDQLMGTVGEKGDLARQAANEKATQAGEKLTALAGSLRDKTQTLEPDHPVVSAATKAAGALEQTGTYLQQHTPDDWMGDLKQLIARKPVESVLIAAGLGYMAARAFKK